MEKYKIIKKLGDGTFGSVSQAKNIKNGEIVAIKRLKEKFDNWGACVNLQEIKALMKLNHPNIVQLHEVIKHRNELYLVFEYLDRNIYQLVKDRKKPLTKIEKRNILFQTLQGIHFMHKIGYFHRDLKPENLLEFKGTVKIADFGLAKQTHLNPPFTEYISTRWYRAPELILGDQKYGKEIDVYAIGCIFAELLANGKPLFPGKNEIDQMDQILRVMGRFDTGTNRWDYGIGLVRKLGYKIPTGIPSQSLLRNTLSDYDIEEPAMDLLEKMLIYDPSKRINALECLQHQYFQVNIPVQIEDQPVFTSNLDFVDHKEEPRRQTNDQRNAKKTSYYLRKARYKPGVNLSEMLRNNLN